jgi:hypothetical protein
MVHIKTTSKKIKTNGRKTTNKKTGSKPKSNKTKSLLSRLSTFFRKKPATQTKKSMSPRLAKLGLSKFIRNAPLSENKLARYVGKKNTRRKMRPLKFKARVFKAMPFKPIKTIIPPWINKKYIKKGRLDFASYVKS